jgi:antitoxin (DNA-binding transcriptional repressor) of toxin-antitoxin stability system
MADRAQKNRGRDYEAFTLGYVWSVDIRDLKAHLRRHLKRVRAGVRIAVTERGRTIATISPVDAPADVDWAHRLVAEGRAQWNGGKPTGNSVFHKSTTRTATSAATHSQKH